MNKGLLNAFNDLRDYNACNHCKYKKSKDCVKGGFCIWNDIEKELKRLEDIDNSLAYGGGIYATNGIIDKKLKALEIIKKKPHISFDLFDTLDTLEEINNYIEFMYGRNDTSILTQEEYDLLKEVMKNE